jgi:hypothetical protein
MRFYRMSNIMKKFIFATIVIFTTATSIPAWADSGQLWLDINVTSIHGKDTWEYNGKEGAYNENNFGLGLGYQVSDFGEWKIGFYENSYNKTSVYAGMRFRTNLLLGFIEDPTWVFAPGLTLGVITGYNDTPEEARALNPVILPSIDIGHRSIGRMNVGFLPATGVNGTHLITFQFGVGF